jgi:hypothetical protein
MAATVRMQHGKYPAYTLLDNVVGGVFKGNGGDDVSMPHHPKGRQKGQGGHDAMTSLSWVLGG